METHNNAHHHSEKNEIDRVRKLVKEEGRTARNLLTYHVPLEEERNLKEKKNFLPIASRSMLVKHSNNDLQNKTPDSRKVRVRSASAGRNPKSELHARHWAFLFENLHRAVDEIYNTCETDESVVECKEMIMSLENFTKEFTALIDWINLKQDYEKTSVLHRPNYLAWEIRKSSPIKHRTRHHRITAKSKAARFLNFDEQDSCSLSSTKISIGTNTDDALMLLKDNSQQLANFSLFPSAKRESTKENCCLISNVDAANFKNVKKEREENESGNVQQSSVRIVKKPLNCTQSGLHHQVLGKNVPKSSNDGTDSRNSSCTWAEKLKGSENKDIAQEKNKLKAADNEGWEVVQRCKSRARNSPLQKSTKKNGLSENKKKDRACSVPLENVKNKRKNIADKSRANLEQNLNSLTVCSLPSLHICKEVASDTKPEQTKAPEIEICLQQKESKSDEDEHSTLDDELESAIQEEEDLNKQIEETKKEHLETDVIAPTSPNLQNSQEKNLDIHFIHQQSEERLGNQLNDLSWGERMDEIEADLRLPGHALHMHEKLSSPSRKRPLMESIRRHEEKQAKAQEQRERLLENKAQKLRDLSKKVEEVRSLKEELLLKRKNIMEEKLQKAELKRRIQLELIKKKAHDEEEKVNEIAFINSLEAQNKRHDVLTRIQGHEARLQDIHGERQRKQEEKAAKEAAAEERRRTLEAERQARLAEIQEKRKRKEDKIEQHQLEKEKERIEQAREKARDREERLSALYAAQQATVEELQKKIQQKQEESARRHEENIEHIRQKALELSILKYSSTADDAPALMPYETKKLCAICNVLIESEIYLLSHLRGKKHQQSIKEHHEGHEPPTREQLEKYNLKYIVDAPAEKIDPQILEIKERQKVLKKKCKKLRQRMTQRGSDYEGKMTTKWSNSVIQSRSKFVKYLRDLSKYVGRPNFSLISSVVVSLERTLGEMSRHLDTEDKHEQHLFLVNRGFQTMGQVWEGLNNSFSPSAPVRVLLTTCTVMQKACKDNLQNCSFILLSNRIGMLLDALVHRLNNLIPDKRGGGGNSTLPSDALAFALMTLITTVFKGLHLHYESHSGDLVPSEATLQQEKETEEEKIILEKSWQLHIQDVLSYAVSAGIVDKVANCFHLVHGPIQHEQPFLLCCMEFVTALTKLHRRRHVAVFETIENSSQQEKQPRAVSVLETAIRATGLVGTVSLLYGVLLHGGAPSRTASSPPPQLSTGTLTLAMSGLRMLNHLAIFNLPAFQGVLGDETLSLEFRHIASYLLWYCSQWSSETELLHELLLTIGYFTVLNTDHQVIIHSGHTPTLLQQLVTLPFPYFSDASLMRILFPTLISSCYLNSLNLTILEQEMSGQLLASFLQDASKESMDENTALSGDESVWRWNLAIRFPQCQWKEAIKFFLK